MISAIILAGGESNEGVPKPLLQYCPGAATFVDQIISVLRDTCVDRITVVLGAQAQKIREVGPPVRRGRCGQ